MRLLLTCTAFASALALLAACGGGGSATTQSMDSAGDPPGTMPGATDMGDGSQPSDPTGSMPGSDVSFPSDLSRSERAAAIRQYAGGDAPELDDATTAPRILAVAQAADSWMVYSGVRAAAPGSLSAGICDSTGCDGITAAAFAAELFSSQEFLPVMVKDGVHVQQSWYTSAATNAMGDWLYEGATFAGIMEHGYFYANQIEFDGQAPAISVNAIGTATGATPATGTATWSGVVTGFDADGWVYGDASLTLDFQDTTVDVAFGNLVGLTGDAPAYDVAPWTDLPLMDGGFQDSDSSRTIQGAFYGPSGEEAGGVFFDLGEGIGGAFGAVRD